MEKVTFTPQNGEPKEILVPETFFYDDSPFSFPPTSDIGVVGDSIFTGSGDTTNPFNQYTKQRDNTWKKVTIKQELQDYIGSNNAVIEQIIASIEALQPYDGTLTMSNFGLTNSPGTWQLNFSKGTLPTPGKNIYFVQNKKEPANPSSDILMGNVILNNMPIIASPLLNQFSRDVQTSPGTTLILNLYNVVFTPVSHSPYIDAFYGTYALDVSGVNITSPTEHWAFEVLPNEGSYGRDIVCGNCTFAAL